MTAAPEMKITALAPWFGGKRNLAPTIVEELGAHAAYWEPFCGGMPVLLQKQPSAHEHVNDLHGDLVNLARVIQDGQWGPWLYRHLRRVLLSEETFQNALAAVRDEWQPGMGRGPDEADARRAIDYFIASWLGRNGVSGTQIFNQTFAVRWKPGGGHSCTRFHAAVDSIPAWRRRMRRVVVLRRDAFEVIESIADMLGIVIYCDPPYLVKGAKYVHDFCDGFMGQANDHERLATALGRFKKTRVVVSYYDHPALKHLYPGWHVRHCPVSKALVSEGKRDGENNVIAPEVLIMNGPSYAKAVA